MEKLRLFWVLVVLAVLTTGCFGGGGQEYRLMTAVEGEGTVTPVTSSKYRPSVLVELTATPAEDWTFFRWEGEGVDDIYAKKTHVAVRSDVNVTAVFVPDDPVQIEDPTLERTVREQVDIMFAPLRVSHIMPVERLNVEELGISSLGGLELFYRLNWLDLGRNQVSDISSLAGLDSLEYLTMSFNQITDLGPLAEVPNLRGLSFLENDVRCIDSLAGLRNLTIVSMDRNQISSIEALRYLTNISMLHMGDNQIEDLDPLRNLPRLRWLDFSRNQVSDISPLVANDAIADGVSVILEGNNLDFGDGSLAMQAIETLIERGVTVYGVPSTE